MKRTTAVRHLVELAEVASETTSRLRALDEISSLRELWVAGDLLDDVDEIDQLVIVVVLNVPDDASPSLDLDPEPQRWVSLLRLDKRPTLHRARPAALPAWDHEHRRVVRLWSAEDGAEEGTIESLRARPLDHLPVVEPTPDQLRAQLARQLPRVEQHLRDVIDHYWDPRWRRAHSGYGVHPDDHLWRAAEAVQSMRDALRDAGS